MKNYFKTCAHRLRAQFWDEVEVLTTHGCKGHGEYTHVRIHKGEEFNFIHFTGFRKTGRLTNIFKNGKFEIMVNGRKEIIEPTAEGKLYFNIEK